MAKSNFAHLTDGELVLFALAKGVARLIPFSSNPNGGEVAFRGIRHPYHIRDNHMLTIAPFTRNDLEAALRISGV